MKGFASSSLNRGEDGTKPKPQHEGPSVDFQDRGRSAFKKQPTRTLSRVNPKPTEYLIDSLR